MSEELNNRGMLFKTEDLEKIVKYANDPDSAFKIKAIFPSDVKEISYARIARQGGHAASSFNADDIQALEIEATIDVAVLEYPKWCDPPTIDGIREVEMRLWLFKEINKFSDEWQRKLKKNKRKSGKGSTETKVSD